MRRSIFPIDHIPKIRGDFNKLVALIFLAFGSAWMQIMLSPIMAQAETVIGKAEGRAIPPYLIGLGLTFGLPLIGVLYFFGFRFLVSFIRKKF